MSPNKISRRDFLSKSGLAVLGGYTIRDWLRNPTSILDIKKSTLDKQGMTQPGAQSFMPDAEVTLTAVKKTVQLLPGTSTRVWGYEGQLVSGSGVDLVNIPNCYLGPILRMKTGTKIRLNMINNLSQETVLHPHGLRVPQNCDGSPMSPVAPGEKSVYEFEVVNRAGPYWFHPHPMLYTPDQVYKGMAGLFYVWDDEEEQVVPGASTGENDIPVIIQDRVFDSYNQLVYQPNMMWGMLGNRILVNGTLDAICSLEPRQYRLRIINGSNARTYKLAWSNGMPLMVIGTDGGLLASPETRDYAMLSPGERIDLWADFSGLADKNVILKSLQFEAGMMGGMGMSGGMGMGGMGMGSRGRMGGMGMMSGGLANGSPLDILTVKVTGQASKNLTLGSFAPVSVKYDASNTSNFNSPQPVVLSMAMMMGWTLNGRVYEMTAVAEDEKVMVDTPISWEFINQSPIPHPMHVHNTQFQVIQRTPSALANYADVSQGFVDTGWKDTVLVWPGQRVKIVMALGPHTGMYMYHCHILEHEDMGMMRNIMVMEM